nr:DUF202 domain-containing protein [Nocardia carnea]
MTAPIGRAVGVLPCLSLAANEDLRRCGVDTGGEAAGYTLAYGAIRLWSNEGAGGERANHDLRRCPMSPLRGGVRESGGGEVAEPGPAPIDYRFTLANERTFLAWIRTSLGLLAGGVAVHTVVVEHWKTDFRAALAVSCLVLSLLVAVGAYLHWRRIRVAMDEGRPLPGTVLVPILSAGTAFVAVLACVAILLH